MDTSNFDELVGQPAQILLDQGSNIKQLLRMFCNNLLCNNISLPNLLLDKLATTLLPKS